MRKELLKKIEKRGREVKLGKGRDKKKDIIEWILREIEELDRRRKRRERRDEKGNEIKKWKKKGIGERILVGNMKDLVINEGIKSIWWKERKKKLNIVREGREEGKKRWVIRLEREEIEGWIERIDEMKEECDSEEGEDKGDKDIRLEIGIVKDLIGSSEEMDLRVGGVLKMLRDDGIGVKIRKWIRIKK